MIGRFPAKLLSTALLATCWVPNTAAAQSTEFSDSIGAIGQIVCKSGVRTMTTTATLVEDQRTVLAVSHFNFNHLERSSIPVSKCSFIIRSVDGAVRYRRSFEVLKRGSEGAAIAFSRATDWALLRLTEDVAEHIRPMKVAFDHDTSEGSEVTLHGYAGQGRFLVRRADCRPAARKPGSAILDHRCKTAPGLSGAPLVQQTPDGLRLVAIHSSRDNGKGLALLIKGYAARSIQRREEVAAL